MSRRATIALLLPALLALGACASTPSGPYARVPSLPTRDWDWSDDWLVREGATAYIRNMLVRADVSHAYHLTDMVRSVEYDGYLEGGARILPNWPDSRLSGAEVANLMWNIEAHARLASVTRVQLWWTPEHAGIDAGWRTDFQAAGRRPYGTPGTTRWDLGAPPSALETWRELAGGMLDRPELMQEVLLTRIDIDRTRGKGTLQVDAEAASESSVEALLELLGGLGTETIDPGTRKRIASGRVQVTNLTVRLAIPEGEVADEPAPGA